jgi:hypothetical protein
MGTSANCNCPVHLGTHTHGSNIKAPPPPTLWLPPWILRSLRAKAYYGVTRQCLQINRNYRSWTSCDNMQSCWWLPTFWRNLVLAIGTLEALLRNVVLYLGQPWNSQSVQIVSRSSFKHLPMKHKSTWRQCSNQERGSPVVHSGVFPLQILAKKPRVTIPFVFV